MGLFDKIKMEADMETKDAVSKEKKVSVAELLKNDEAILEGISVLIQKMDSMDKNNKKFLMAATISDERTEHLEETIHHMKMGVIALLDQIDFMMSAVCSGKENELVQGFTVFQHKIAEIITDMGLEEIPVTEKMKFNSKEQECSHTEHREDYEDEVIVALLHRGYRDKKNGKILRFAAVSVNKR